MFKSGVLNVSRFLYFGKYSKDRIDILVKINTIKYQQIIDNI